MVHNDKPQECSTERANERTRVAPAIPHQQIMAEIAGERAAMRHVTPTPGSSDCPATLPLLAVDDKTRAAKAKPGEREVGDRGRGENDRTVKAKADGTEKGPVRRAVDALVAAGGSIGRALTGNDETAVETVRAQGTTANVVRQAGKLDVAEPAKVEAAAGVRQAARVDAADPARVESTALLRAHQGGAPDMVASANRTVLAEGKPILVEGKPLLVEGRPTHIEGSHVHVEGKQLLIEGKQVVFDGKQLLVAGKALAVGGKTLEAQAAGLETAGQGSALAAALSHAPLEKTAAPLLTSNSDQLVAGAQKMLGEGHRSIADQVASSGVLTSGQAFELRPSKLTVEKDSIDVSFNNDLKVALHKAGGSEGATPEPKVFDRLEKFTNTSTPINIDTVKSVDLKDHFDPARIVREVSRQQTESASAEIMRTYPGIPAHSLESKSFAELQPERLAALTNTANRGELFTMMREGHRNELPLAASLEINRVPLSVNGPSLEQTAALVHAIRRDESLAAVPTRFEYATGIVAGASPARFERVPAAEETTLARLTPGPAAVVRSVEPTVVTAAETVGAPAIRREQLALPVELVTRDVVAPIRPPVAESATVIPQVVSGSTEHPVLKTWAEITATANALNTTSDRLPPAERLAAVAAERTIVPPRDELKEAVRPIQLTEARGEALRISPETVLSLMQHLRLPTDNSVTLTNAVVERAERPAATHTAEATNYRAIRSDVVADAGQQGFRGFVDDQQRGDTLQVTARAMVFQPAPERRLLTGAEIALGVVLIAGAISKARDTDRATAVSEDPRATVRGAAVVYDGLTGVPMGEAISAARMGEVVGSRVAGMGDQAIVGLTPLGVGGDTIVGLSPRTLAGNNIAALSGDIAAAAAGTAGAALEGGRFSGVRPAGAELVAGSYEEFRAGSNDEVVARPRSEFSEFQRAAASSTVRSTWLINPGDTLVSLAERFYDNSLVAFLIADINKASTKQVLVEGKRVVQLFTRQSIFLPNREDLAIFFSHDLSKLKAEDLITIISEREFDRQLVHMVMDKAMGVTSNVATLPAPAQALRPSPVATSLITARQAEQPSAPDDRRNPPMAGGATTLEGFMTFLQVKYTPRQDAGSIVRSQLPLRCKFEF